MMSKFRNDNFYQISGWMLNELKLSGNELIIYAIIYGFSQDNNSYYTGSISYMVDATNTSRNTVIRSLKNLVDNGLLLKEDVFVSGVKFVKYKAIVNFDSSILTPLNPKCKKGSTNLAPNNNINTNIYIPSEIFEDEKPKKDLLIKDITQEQSKIISSQAFKAKLFHDLFKYNLKSLGQKSFKILDKSKLDEWIKCIIKIESNGYTNDDFNLIYEWLRGNTKQAEFWKPNIQSANSLQDKFDRLIIDARKELIQQQPQSKLIV